MKRALFYIATTLYSNAQAVRASIKKVRYAIFAFIAATLMLLAPVSISKVTTSGESLIKNFPTAEFMLHDFILEMDEKGVTCKIEAGKLNCKGVQLTNKVFEREYEETINNKKYTYRYTFVLGDDTYNTDINPNITEYQANDNIVFFGEEEFLLRSTTRDKEGKLVGSLSIQGDYSRVGSFDFENIAKRKSNEASSRAELHTMFADLLYAVSISDFNVILLLWLILSLIVNFFCVLSGGFILNYGNKKGNLGDEYGFKGSLKIACNLLLLPAILSVLVGLFMPESVIITAPIIFYIRVFFIYRAQFTRKGQKLAIKTKKGLEEYI